MYSFEDILQNVSIIINMLLPLEITMVPTNELKFILSYNVKRLLIQDQSDGLSLEQDL